ncbi:MAG: 3-phosphoglycerate dehydrogenase [Oscillospiraceae bacterium]|jgi:D-3-phosphoglycerate dehydrogenase|nr:3-phosphoglycerate dehydrogenase [Oscillospiraceae bacterium]
MYKIRTLNSIAPAGFETLDTARYSVSGDEPNPDAILVRSAPMHDMEFGPELLCIARAGAGTNNIPIDRCGKSGVIVFNTPGANAEAVKELVMCSLMLSSRDITGGIAWVKKIASEGGDVSALVEKGKGAFSGPEVHGKTLGVIGLGAVGAKTAHAAHSLGMQVYGYDPYLSVDAAWRLSSDILHARDLDTIYANSDYITIHVPYLDATHRLIDSKAIAKMRDGVRIINLARAELVSDDDIIEAIAAKKVACYVTDFPNAKTAGAKGVIAIPHLGASTPESEENCAQMAVREIVDYIENGNIVNAVNMPFVMLPRTGDMRICVIHKNIPDMIAKITGAVSACGINIENMINAGSKGRGEAYTVIDAGSVSSGLGDAIRAIDGVIRVRILE